MNNISYIIQAYFDGHLDPEFRKKSHIRNLTKANIRKEVYTKLDGRLFDGLYWLLDSLLEDQ